MIICLEFPLKYEHYKDVYSYNHITFLPLHRKIVWIQEIPYPSQGRFLHQFGLPHASGNSNLASKSKGIQPIFFQIGYKNPNPLWESTPPPPTDTDSFQLQGA